MLALSRVGGSAVTFVLWGMMLVALLLLQPRVARADELDQLREQALILLNQSRKEHNLPPLVLEAKLNKAAQGHANDMLKRKYFAHASPEGKTAGDRYRQAGGSKWLVTAENIATFSNTHLPITNDILKNIQKSWMNSPGHRKNILLRGVTEFGFGLAVDAQGNLYAVQNFAGPGTDTDAAGREGRPIRPQEQVALVLAVVNAERKKAGRAPLGADDALNRGAVALLPGKGADEVGFAQKNVLDLIPEVDGWGWSAVDVMRATCGGCGTKPIGADIGNFTGQWMHDEKYRAMLLKAETTHLGFAIGADGMGKKVAICIFGEGERR